jgi:hypothetical protein
MIYGVLECPQFSEISPTLIPLCIHPQPLTVALSLSPFREPPAHTLAEERARRADKAYTHMLVEGFKAAGIAAVVLGGANFIASKVWAGYHKLPRSPLLFWSSSLVVAAWVIKAEQAHLELMNAFREDSAQKRSEADDKWRAR